MHEHDHIVADCEPTASGILLCLRMLAEESLSLNLRRGVLALRAAALVIEAESSDLDDISQHRPRFISVADVGFADGGGRSI